MSKINKVLAFLPISSSMRGKCYKLLCLLNKKSCIGDDFRIGFGSYIDCSTINISNHVQIGNMVRIKYLDYFEIGDNSSIGSSTVVCGAYDINKFDERNLIIGRNCGILCSHYFDVVAPIKIGNNVTIAGKYSQFYTHSFDLNHNRLDGEINIGNDVYIGAGALINLGVYICDKVVIQGGTCVNKDVIESGVYCSYAFIKRGEVREYRELFADKSNKMLDDGCVVYSKTKGIKKTISYCDEDMIDNQ